MAARSLRRPATDLCGISMTSAPGPDMAGPKIDVQPVRRRNSEETRESIMATALQEFSEFGLDGARTDRIAKRAGVNIRMLYHYFGSKNGLYSTVLEREFLRLRNSERDLNIAELSPADALARLTEFTFDYFNENPHVVRLFALENHHHAEHLQDAASVTRLSSSLIDTLGDVIAQGVKEGLFRRDVDPVQLYMSIVALSCFHVSNGPTMSTIFQRDLRSRDWLVARRRHVQQMVESYLAT
jgi:TetR/AcrR family transcriptional regulator